MWAGGLPFSQVGPAGQGGQIYQMKMHSESEDSCSLLSDSMRPHGLQPARLLCPRDSPLQEYWSGPLFPSPGIFPTQGSDQVSRIAGEFFTVWATREAHPSSHTRNNFSSRTSHAAWGHIIVCLKSRLSWVFCILSGKPAPLQAAPSLDPGLCGSASPCLCPGSPASPPPLPQGLRSASFFLMALAWPMWTCASGPCLPTVLEHPAPGGAHTVPGVPCPPWPRPSPSQLPLLVCEGGVSASCDNSRTHPARFSGELGTHKATRKVRGGARERLEGAVPCPLGQGKGKGPASS